MVTVLCAYCINFSMCRLHAVAYSTCTHCTESTDSTIQFNILLFQVEQQPLIFVDPNQGEYTGWSMPLFEQAPPLMELPSFEPAGDGQCVSVLPPMPILTYSLPMQVPSFDPSVYQLHFVGMPDVSRPPPPVLNSTVEVPMSFFGQPVHFPDSVALGHMVPDTSYGSNLPACPQGMNKFCLFVMKLVFI